MNNTAQNFAPNPPPVPSPAPVGHIDTNDTIDLDQKQYLDSKLDRKSATQEKDRKNHRIIPIKTQINHISPNKNKEITLGEQSGELL